MCGIIAVVRRRSDPGAPTRSELLRPLEPALPRSTRPRRRSPTRGARSALAQAADAGRATSTGSSAGRRGCVALLGDRRPCPTSSGRVHQAARLGRRRRAELDHGDTTWASPEVERVNAALVRAARTRCGRSRATGCRTAAAVADLAGPDAGLAAIDGFHVGAAGARRPSTASRSAGRDSAGTAPAGRGHGLDLTDLDRPSCSRRARSDPLFTSRAVRRAPTAHLSFVYKAAAEIGELGDNTAALRAAIRADELLHAGAAPATAEVDRAGPHPLGQRRHHLRAQRPPAQLRRARAARTART